MGAHPPLRPLQAPRLGALGPEGLPSNRQPHPGMNCIIRGILWGSVCVRGISPVELDLLGTAWRAWIMALDLVGMPCRVWIMGILDIQWLSQLMDVASQRVMGHACMVCISAVME